MANQQEIEYRPISIEAVNDLDWELSVYEALFNLPREAWEDEQYRCVAEHGTPIAWLYSVICCQAKDIIKRTEAQTPQAVAGLLNQATE
jgi:hypothetical protein